MSSTIDIPYMHLLVRIYIGRQAIIYFLLVEEINMLMEKKGWRYLGDEMDQAIYDPAIKRSFKVKKKCEKGKDRQWSS